MLSYINLALLVLSFVLAFLTWRTNKRISREIAEQRRRLLERP